MIDFGESTMPSGMDQEHRLLPGLEEGYFNVDEMSFEDLLAASVEFASSLTYYNSSLQASGDWRSFLASNEIAIMALIINKDVEKLRKKFLAPGTRRPEAIVSPVFELLMELDKWVVDLKRSSSVPARELMTKLEVVIEGTLLQEAHNIGVLTGYLRSQDHDMSGIDLGNLSDIWRVSGAGDSPEFPGSIIRAVENDEVAYRNLIRAGFEFLNAIEHLKSHCRVLLPRSLKTQSHDPAVSLFITFLKLYKYAQENINSFTQRHLDFYYREILKTQYKNKSPETVILNFSIPEGGEPIDIEEGREFTCAKDKDLHDVVFRATGNLTVNDAEIAALYTLRFNRERMITPECDLNFVTRIHKQKLPLSLSEEEISEGKSQPLFGDGIVRRNADDEIDEAPETGIALASKTLFLDEGDRRITLDVGLARAIKPITSYIKILEQASGRTEFKSRLHELLLGWIGDEEHQDWDLAVPEALVGNIRTTAETVDKYHPPAGIGAAAGSEFQVGSCSELLEEALDRVRGGLDRSYPYYAPLLQSETGLEFRTALGEFITHFLLEEGSAEDLLNGVLDDRARELGCENSLDAIKNEVKLGRERLFKKYFGTAFVLHLSTEEGWFVLDRYDVVEADKGGAGFKILFSLASEAPPVTGCLAEVHGSNWDTELPLLKLSLHPEASLNVYSLLENFLLDRVTVTAEVYGARNIVAYNNISQLDPSKPFYPFGPAPTTSSYFAFAAPEAARKHLDAFRVHLHWGDLPQGEEGFNGHYENYPSKFRNQSFAARVNVLNNGKWQPASAAQAQTARLFDTYDKKLKELKTIDIESVDSLKPVGIDLANDELDLGLKTRNGFIKLTLASPEAAFGHLEYPLHLSATLEANARKKLKKKGKLPKAPYTPLLNKVAVDYIASSSIAMRSRSKARDDKYPEKVYRLHAFGAEKVYPGAGEGPTQLFKPFNYDGNLLLGLSASNIRGVISIYFSLSDDSERARSGKQVEHRWSYLTAGGWVGLREDQIISDGTKGFLCSGIVTIEMPRDISNDHTDMPGSYYWLKVATDAGSRNFCSLRRVKTHALKLCRSDDDLAEFNSKDARISKMAWQPVTSIPGLESISQLDAFTDIGKDETRRQLVTRVSERIRHRARAALPWDFERLILEKFPIVGKVMCLPNRSGTAGHAVPGSLLVVVTPRVVDADETIGKTPKLSAVYLNDIHEYVSGLSSTFARIEVANPTYEWVQIRCAAVFEKYAKDGIFIDRLNADIGRYLNPWSEVGYGLEFCQPVKQDDVCSYIFNLDYVKYVTDFSMLHITRDGSGFYRLGDTVDEGSTVITPNYPWSLIVPLKRHYIEVSPEIVQKEPDVTGIRELEIGNTFIVSGI